LYCIVSTSHVHLAYKIDKDYLPPTGLPRS